MKLKSFRIENYKSIIDSGEQHCYLSNNDNITVLAGQNESGKSSILQALRDFEFNEVSEESFYDSEIPIKVTCKYEIEKEYDIESKLLKNEKLDLTEFTSIFKELKEIIFIKSFLVNEKSSSIYFDDVFYSKIFNAFYSSKINSETTISESEKESYKKLVDDYIDSIILELFDWLPRMVFFDDFCDLLPNSILLADLKNKNTKAKGYQAVKNIEIILDKDFTKFENLKIEKHRIEEKKYQESFTADFNEKWKQRISDGSGATIHILYDSSLKTMNFFIETKKDELLPPERRSQGLKWFLSFYLQLKAYGDQKNLVILFDEPGLYLHSRAQEDMMKVFEELSKNNQIIYSTHSPYLINSNKLNRIRLVLNIKKEGTVIEKITTNKIQNQKEALKPIIDAMGLNIAHNFSPIAKRNIIVEGISDFYYFTAMKNFFDNKGQYSFLPAMGAQQAHLLMELCIGWGLEWLIIFDDKDSKKELIKIKKAFFNNEEEELNKKVLTLNNFEGIEDMFSLEDFKKVKNEVTNPTKIKLNELVTSYGGKELFARLFLEKVNTNKINKDTLSKETQANFQNVFSFIKDKFK